MNKEIPVFISGDENYAPYMAVLIASACYNTDSFLKFYVIGDPVQRFTQQQILSMKKKFCNFDIEFLNINMRNIFSSFREASSFASAPYWSNTTYARILIPELKTDINKAINLDSDVIICGDLQTMYDIDMEGFALAGVPDNYMINQCFPARGNYLGFSKMHLKKYFNAGVLIFDCQKWRENHISEKILKLQDKYREKIVYVEQDLLNKYFDNDYKIIGSEFNLMNSSVSTIIECPERLNGLPYSKWDCIVRHFEGPMKPWLYDERIYPDYQCKTHSFDEYWFYAAMTPFYQGLKMMFQNKRFEK